MSLQHLRGKIDLLDRELLKILGKRQEIATEIAAVKQKLGMRIFDPKREAELLKEKQKLAAKYGLPPHHIEKIFRALFETSRSSQHSYFEIAEKLKPKKLVYREKIIQTKLGLMEIFARLKQNYETCFLLESLGEGADFSPRSFLGFSPYAIISAEEGKLIVDGKAFATPNPYEALKNFLPKLPRGSGFRGGLFGYLTYEATRYFEPSVEFKKHADFPDFEFGLYYDGLILDKQTGKLKYFYLVKDRSAELLKVLVKPLKREAKFKAKAQGTNIAQKDFEKKVAEGKEEILAGNTFQFQFGRKYFYELSGNRMEFYEALREINPSPHMFYLKFGERELIGSSPELIVRVEKGVVENYPLAGTRRRGKDAAEDAAIAQKLLNDPKEKAEHMMLVDLGRNDIGRVSEFGSVKVRKLMEIKRFSHVQHIGSEIVGRLRKGLTAFDALAAQTPVGTVSGAPKIETMKIIERLEKDARGPYAGAIGLFSLTGDCIFAANLRSLYASGKNATVQASAGIVADSVPAHEFGEVEKKVKGVVTALEKSSKGG
ncbi:MAG: chorismate-binding protein [Candidatus Gracilibacteria bacterium]|nr:chorismate-binding protein [Candidatus Gracilibacteria bacterium]